METGSATCDTSVLVSALASWHPRHDETRDILAARVDAIPAHVLLECYSVLTRLPAPHRVAAAVAGEVLDQLELPLLTLPASRHRTLVTAMARAGLRGGAVYDAVVGATALHHGRRLLTVDRRARTTYEVVGAGYEFV
ncbi:MAG: PIN domain-containing protein [Nocardioides sp.]